MASKKTPELKEALETSKKEAERKQVLDLVAATAAMHNQGEMASIGLQYAELCDEINARKAELKELGERKDAMSDQLIERMSADSTLKFTVKDKADKARTIYIHKQTWAKLAEGMTKEDGVKALKKAKLGDMVKEDYNSNTLSAFIRECEDAKRPLPKALISTFTFNPTYEARVVSGGKG